VRNILRWACGRSRMLTSRQKSGVSLRFRGRSCQRGICSLYGGLSGDEVCLCVSIMYHRMLHVDRVERKEGSDVICVIPGLFIAKLHVLRFPAFQVHRCSSYPVKLVACLLRLYKERLPAPFHNIRDPTTHSKLGISDHGHFIKRRNNYHLDPIHRI
jgi:hypothetical protein